MSEPERIGPAIKRLRETRDMTQGQLAEYAHVGRPWLSRVETGSIQRPSAMLLIRLARALRMPLSEFWEAIGYIPPHLQRLASDEFAPSVLGLATYLQSLPPIERESMIGVFEAVIAKVENAKQQP
jgi:transcriptional regulator with XRE-family HTH domain